MGLRHIWGDITCGNDGIDDTPIQAATRGCPSGVLPSCNNEAGGAMYNNYMDLTNDECMNMFTIGQMQKMRASFASDGPHAALSHSNAASAIPLPEPAQPVLNPEVSPLIKLYSESSPIEYHHRYQQPGKPDGSKSYSTQSVRANSSYYSYIQVANTG